MDTVHIRTADNRATFSAAIWLCVSLRHYEQNPSLHVGTLPICQACAAKAKGRA